MAASVNSSNIETSSKDICRTDSTYNLTIIGVSKFRGFLAYANPATTVIDRLYRDCNSSDFSQRTIDLDNYCSSKNLDYFQNNKINI